MDQLYKFAYCNLSNNRGCNFFLHGAILSGVKSKPGLFWFYPTLPVTSPEKLRHPLKQVDANSKNNRDSAIRLGHALPLRVLVGWWCCKSLFWLVPVIALALVFQHLTENCLIAKTKYILHFSFSQPREWRMLPRFSWAQFRETVQIW